MLVALHFGSIVPPRVLPELVAFLPRDALDHVVVSTTLPSCSVALSLEPTNCSVL